MTGYTKTRFTALWGQRIARMLPKCLILGGVLLCCFTAPLSAQDALEVVQVVLSQTQLEAGQPLLVQVLLRNTSSRGTAAGLRVGLLRDRSRAVSPAQTRRLTRQSGAKGELPL